MGIESHDVRVAAGADRRVAATIIQRDFGVDLLFHEATSGADVSFLAWPATGPIQAAAAFVLHRDGIGFIHMPAGERDGAALKSLYAGLRHHAIKLHARVALVVLTENLISLAPELIKHGFEHVSDVMTMESRERSQTRMLGRLANHQPMRLTYSSRDDARLARLIQATYIESLSDPSLGSDHNAAGFIERLKFESPDHSDRFVLEINDTDCAACLLSRYDGHGYIGVRYLGVAPRFRGRKLGSQLLAASLAIVWSSEYRYATVDVDSQNTFAIDVYEELGFATKSKAGEFLLPLH